MVEIDLEGLKHKEVEDSSSKEESFQIANLIFVKLKNLANAIGSGEPNFASIVCLAGHGEIFFKEVASNIKYQYDVDL